jgi:misacylated tRNA(Ala) deacylase
MTEPLFREDAYLREADGVVRALTDRGGVVLDASVFYPTGGGQPGDQGRISWGGGEMAVATTVKGDGEDIVLVPAEGATLCARYSTGTPATVSCGCIRRCIFSR